MSSFIGNFLQKAKECCSKPSKFKEFVTGKKEILPYMDRFFIIQYSKDSLEKGVTGDMGKVIYIYDIDDFGKRKVEVKLYSKERERALREVHKIPGTDLTESVDSGIPVYTSTNLMEARYS